jgi:type II secretory ATPase GspE/PulE/Tfp pilus assembly ATPase PilB-like protein/nucleotide-binding universal stress UspA family protein
MANIILFPTDYSDASNAALRYAVSLARQAGSSLMVVHVKPPARPRHGTPAPPDDDKSEDEAALVTLLTTIAGDKEKPVPHDFRNLRGDPAGEIVRLAEKEEIDLIVMATAGRTGLRRVLMGSVAEAVVSTAPCPVLCLKEPALNFKASRAAGDAAEFRSDPNSGESVGSHNESDRALEDGRPSAVALMGRAIVARATDVHIDPLDDEMEVRVRIDGRLEHFCRLHQDVAHPLITQLKVMADFDIANPFCQQEGRISLPDPLDGHEIRITRVPVIGGESISLRVLNRQHLLRTLDSLGLSPDSLARLHEMLQLGEGVVLVTGPAGSGKTTTAYSMVHGLDDGRRNIVTIEDPPEYRIASMRQMSVDARHDVTMTSGLRTLLRMDPDVVLVGEIRDAETAEIAMRAASSGKYVFTTLHTRDVASTITALRDLHIDNRSLAGNLTGIVSQRLVRRICVHCRQDSPLDAAISQLFASEDIEPPATLPKPQGCAKCRNIGYHERVGVFEVALPDVAICEAIEQGASEEELRQLLRSKGTRSLLADGLNKVRDGITTLDEVRSMTWVPFPG